MGTLERSLALAKKSFAVLRSNPQLLWFPIVSSMFTIALTVSFFLPLYFASGGMKGLEKTDHMPPVYYVVLAAFYLCSYFVVIFFNTGLVSCAHASLRGQNMTFAEGLRAAAQRLPSILGWTVIAATVGMILQMISERSGLIGKIVVGLIGGAWNLVTFFVIPILAVEQGSPVDAIKKSAVMLKRTWGENAIGGVGMGILFFLLSMVALVPLVFAFAAIGVVAGLVTLAVVLLYWMLLATVAASLSGIYRTALYLYAETGAVPGYYDADVLQNAFRQGKPSVINRWRNR